MFRIKLSFHSTVIFCAALILVLSASFAGHAQRNPIDDPDFFVRQQYLDFLNRTADQAGLDFWKGQINSCNGDAVCIDIKRQNVASAYFLSIEFYQTGFLVYRLYKSSFGNIAGKPVPVTFQQFLPDLQTINNGVIVGQTGYEQQLENNKVAFVAAFVNRIAFRAVYPDTLTPAQFVDQLNANTGNSLSQTDRDNLVNGLMNGSETRATVLRKVAENKTFTDAEFNRGFVLLEYFGFYRRNPDDAPDGNFGGYNFWLARLTSFGGDYIKAEMVRGFIVSSEYRARFLKPVQHVLDFDGDGKTDFCVVRNVGVGPSGQLRWFYNINGSNAATAAFDWGLNNDVLVPADYDGDGKTDIAVWRGDSSPAFYILQSKTNTVRVEPFGQIGDDPTVVADYNADGSADVAVYRTGVGSSQSFWFYRTVSGGPTFYVPWGIAGDKPAPGDYDGDGKADFGIVRTEGVNLRWWILTAKGATDGSTLFGLTTDKVVTGDFDGDGITDKAVVRSSGGALTWYDINATRGTEQLTFGLTGDTVAVGDYDGNGTIDIAVWRNGVFYIFYTGGSVSPSAGTVSYFQLGGPGDRVPASINAH